MKGLKGEDLEGWNKLS